MLQLERRPEASTTLRWLSPLLALALPVATGFLLFLAMGKDAIQALPLLLILH